MTQKTSEEHNCANLVVDKGKPTQRKSPAHIRAQRGPKGQDSCCTADSSILHFLDCHSLQVAPKTEIFLCTK